MQPYRSLLFVPGHKPGWVGKAARSGADAVIIDLEDAVPEAAKAGARDGLHDAVREARSAAPNVGVLVRPNGSKSSHVAADLEAVVPASPDALLVPKVDRADDLDRLNAVLDHLERRDDVSPRVEVVASLESASGLVNAATIAAAPRVAGALAAAAQDGDTARSVGFRWSPAGTETLGFRSQVVLACRAAADRHPVVGLWQDLRDLDGLAAFARGNRDLGFRGQVVIHPSHVEAVNAAYTPDPSLVAYYEELVATWEAAQATGDGAVVFDGEHVDVAHVQTARDVVAFARRLAELG